MKIFGCIRPSASEMQVGNLTVTSDLDKGLKNDGKLTKDEFEQPADFYENSTSWSAAVIDCIRRPVICPCTGDDPEDPTDDVPEVNPADKQVKLGFLCAPALIVASFVDAAVGAWNSLRMIGYYLTCCTRIQIEEGSQKRESPDPVGPR